MYKALKPFILVCFVIFAWLNSRAQTSSNTHSAVMGAFQDSLIKLSSATFSADSNTQRFASNAEFVKALVNALKTPGSYAYHFDSLQNISEVESPDKTFKLFSWFVPTDEGTYHFFGAIQMHTKDGKLKLFPLIDDTDNFKDTNAITDNRKWYGSRYYEIIPVANPGKAPFYALLGWKGNNRKTSKKVIEILSFENNLPVFGKPVIEGQKNTAVKNRMVFEYNKLNSMTLRMDKSVSMIVLDHLAPFNPQMAGNFEFYASDLSFDGYKPVAGKLKLVENIEVKNDPDDQDDFYVDPTRKDIPARKKF